MIRSLTLLAVLCLAGPALAVDHSPLVINEFMAGNGTGIQDAGGDYDDWIEIYNLGDQAVDIAGMYLTDDLSDSTKWQVPGSDASETTVDPHGYVLIWADQETAEGVLHAGFKLSSTGEEIGFYDADGTLIDSVVFGPQTSDVSYGRFPDAAVTWQAFTIPSPGQSNQMGDPGIVISEIMYYPYSESLEAENPQDEYLELFNRSGASVDLTGWRFTAGVDFTFGSVTLAAGAYMVVAADVEAFSAKYPAQDNVVGGWAGRLSNSGETIELRDASDVIVDSVRYADEGDWGVRELGPADYNHRGWTWRNEHDGGGMSLEQVNLDLPNEYGQNWAASASAGGTPGYANSRAADSSAPLIAAVQHAPVIPSPLDPVTVTARVIGESGQSAVVRLCYRVDRSLYEDRDVYPEYQADSYTVVAMFDDGEHGDGAARDGVYGAQTPAQPDGTVVEFYVEASDNAGQVRTWPAPSGVDGQAQQVTNALYRVDAAFDPQAYWTIGGEPLYYLIMTEMERGRLAYIGAHSNDGYSRSEMNGTFISVDGESVQLRYNVGIRNRGNGSRTPPPNNYRVNFPHDRIWKGVASININSKYTYTQVLGHTIFHMAGLPALDVKPVQVRVNGEDIAVRDPGRMYGSYVHLEVYDSDWAGNHFPDDSQGNLYRCVSRGRHTDLRYRGEDPSAYSRDDYYAKSTNSGVNDYSDLIALTYALDESSDETYVQEVEKVVNVDQWMRWLALETLLVNRETNLSNGYGDDYCMYRGVEDPRFILLPYDLDSVIRSSDPNTSIWLAGRMDSLRVVRRFLTHPDFTPRYFAQLKDLAETVLAPERFDPLLDQVLGGWVPQSQIDSMKAFMVARRAYVLSVIPEAFSVASDFPLTSGYARAIGPVVIGENVRGTADPIRTRSVLVNGELAQWSLPYSDWSLGSTVLDLFPGINRVTAEGFDGLDGTGNRVASGYTDIYYNPGFTNDYPKQELPDGPPGDDGTLGVNLVVRDSYLPGVPVLVRVELVTSSGRVDKDIWDDTVVLSVDSPTVGLSADQFPVYHGLGSGLVTFSGRGDFILRVQVHGLEAEAFLSDLSVRPIHVASGTLAASEIWSGVCHITGEDFTIPAGVTLTLNPGCLVLIDGVPSGSGGTDIDVAGSIRSLGTAASPVTLTAFAPGENWGELHHEAAAPSLYQYTHITQAGHSPRVGHSNSGPAIRAADSTLVFDHAALTDHAGKIMHATSGTDLTFRKTLLSRSVMGPEIAGTALLFEDCWITDMHASDDADGIYIHDQLSGQQCRLTRSVIADIDDDGIDTLGSEITVEDVIVRGCKDKGISVFGGETTINRSLVVGNNIAPEDPTVASIAAKAFAGATAVVNIDHTTVVTSKTPGVVDVGVQSHNKYGVSDGTIVYNVTNSIVEATVPIDVQAPYSLSDIHVSYSAIVGQTWAGLGNIDADPQFADVGQNDYRLSDSSPCLGAASPGDPAPDLGYYQRQPGTFSAATTTAAGMLWTAQEGPYRVTADLTIPADATLTIMPGTTVFFDPDVKLTIQGRLLAEGTPYKLIRFTRTPESGDTWGGLQFVDSGQDNRIAYAVIEYGRTNDGLVGVENSNLLLDHVTLDHTDLRRIRTIDSSLVVRHCVFTDIFGPDEPPSTDNLSEHIWGTGVPKNGQFIIENNTFGLLKGHNDAIDFDGATRPDAIPQIRNNVFAGGGDDALDLETDAHVEGNVFMNFRKDRYNTSPRESNVLSAGRGKDYVVVRNVFANVGHVAQVKGEAFMVFSNNTVVNASAAAFYFEIPGQAGSPGRGVWMDSSIFWNSPRLVENFRVDDPTWGTTDIAMDRCLALADWHVLGDGNLDADPLFVDARGDYHLQPMSAAHDAGFWGLDMGAYVAAGASVAGEPAAVTHRRQAQLTVGGPGITAYKYSLNGPMGPWSAERPVDMPVELSGLEDGQSYTVYVLGKDSAGIWQEQANASKTWTVDTTYERLVLNEVLAVNAATYPHEGTFPDLIELYYDGPAALSLAGMSLSDDPAQPDKFVFPVGATIRPGEYVILFADTNGTTSGWHLGFGLADEGDRVTLYDRNGGVIDALEFGHQLPDLSIGRVGDEGRWTLTAPSFGTANVVQPLGDAGTVRINEWLAQGEVTFGADFIELYNPHTSPVDVGGFYLTDQATSQPAKYAIRPLSFIAGQGVVAFDADGLDLPGHVNFKLSNDGELIGLFDKDLKALDRVYYRPQTPDVSQGRSPDGADQLAYFILPTPGLANPALVQTTITSVTLLPEDAPKRALIPLAADEVGPEWKSDVAFDDSTWLSASGGPGGVGYERGSGYENLISLDVEQPMYGVNTACYVRIPFQLEAGVTQNLGALQFAVRYDDAFVAYLNGTEIARISLSGTPQWDSEAEDNHEASSMGFDAVLDLSEFMGLLRDGDNLLAIHGLNASRTSSDFIISAALTGSILEVEGADYPYLKELELLDGLRITEVMYNAQSGDDADYIELQNTGEVPLDLTGLRFTDGVTFTFPAMSLAPGACTVVVGNLAVFDSTYGAGASVAGEYAGRLSNRGETLVLQLADPFEAAVMRFRYKDSWYSATDGGGKSLAVNDVAAAVVTWNDRGHWYAADPTPGQP